MSTDPGQILLPIARNAIAEQLGQPTVEANDIAWLHKPGATFVTLTQSGELRGCIGTLQAHRTLLEDVQENAVAAAFQDPRFRPLQALELQHTRVEVSLLSPSEAIVFESEQDALAQLRPDIDGVIFEYGYYRSTFLPQVWEQLPDPQTFMSHLKRKAGLSADFWAANIKLARYTVHKWKEPSDHSEQLA